MDIPILIGVLILIGAAVFSLVLAVGLVVVRLIESFVRLVMMPREPFHSYPPAQTVRHEQPIGHALP
jgi:hypothetical protein